MKKLSDFIISYIVEAETSGVTGAAPTPSTSYPYVSPDDPRRLASTPASAPTTASAPETSDSPSVVSDSPYSKRLGGMVKAKRKEAQDLLNRMKRVAARQEAAGGVDPGVESKIAELEDQLSPEGQIRIFNDEKQKLESGIERVKAGKQFSNLPSGMFKTTPKTAAEQEAYDAAKSAFDLMGKEGSEEAFEKSRQASAAVDAERKSASKISPVYQVTQGDFKTATGQDYDPRNPQHRQLFFDLAAKGSPTWSATAGVGEGPAYGSQAFYTMRGRPQNIPQFGTPEAWYDEVEGGAIAPTTPETRARKSRKENEGADPFGGPAPVFPNIFGSEPPPAPEPASPPDISPDPLSKEEREKIEFGPEVATGDLQKLRGFYGVPKRAPEPASPPDLAPEFQGNFPFDVERGQFPIFPKKASKFGQALNKAAENVIGSVGPKVSDFIKRNLAQTTPNAMRLKLYGTTDVPGAVPVPDQERGQFPIFTEPAPAPEPASPPDLAPEFQGNFPFDVERGQFPIFPEQEIETTKEPEILQVNLGLKPPEFKGYVVPESEAWNKLSEEEKSYMAAFALQRGEAHKLFGGRQATQGGFLGIGGKKINRFSEDNRGETPSETAYMNRVARMLNQMLDADERKAKEAREFGPEVETGILQGESPVNLNSQTPKSVEDYLDKVLLRKYRKPSKSEKQDLENSLSPEQLRQLFSGRGNLQGLDNFLTPEQIRQLRQQFSNQTNKQVKMAPNVRIEVPGMSDPKEWAMSKLDPRQREEEDGEGIMGSRGVPGRELSIPDEEEPRRSPRRR